MLMCFAYASGPSVLALLWIRMAMVNRAEKRLKVPADSDRNGLPLTQAEAFEWSLLRAAYQAGHPADLPFRERLIEKRMRESARGEA